MIKHGSPPYLECSSQGDKRFSAFYARLRAYNGRSIEDIYQAAKIFDDGRSGLNWREAKGRRAVNQAECSTLYAALWDQYIAENPKLVPLLTSASGLSDKFGRPGSCCQATELWRIREREMARALQLELPTTQFHDTITPAPLDRQSFADRYAEAYRQYFRDNPKQLEQLLRAKTLNDVPALEGADVRPSPLLWTIRNEELHRRQTTGKPALKSLDPNIDRERD
jgi:hypothetical protein